MTNLSSQATDQRIEMKFQLDAPLAAQVRAWAREHLGIDANCNAQGDDTYDLNTLYLDTPAFDLFHRTGVAGSAKHRIRRYGNEAVLWMETKRKRKMVVRKNRTAVAENELASHLEAFAEQTQMNEQPRPWCGDWFLQRLTDRALRPAIEVAYRRFARTAMIDGESLRLTIDSHMSARKSDGWNVAKTNDPAASDRRQVQFGDSEVLELKFHNHMPQLFKQLLRTFAIPATGFSKYRNAVLAVGLVPERFDSARECLLNA